MIRLSTILAVLLATGFPPAHAHTPLTIAFGVATPSDSSITLQTYDARTARLLARETLDLTLPPDLAPASTPVLVVGSTGWDPLNPDALRVHLLSASTGTTIGTGLLHIAHEPSGPARSSLVAWTATPSSPVTLRLRARDPLTHTTQWIRFVTGVEAAPIVPIALPTPPPVDPSSPTPLIDCTILYHDPRDAHRWSDTFAPLSLDQTPDESDLLLDPLAPARPLPAPRPL
jgi:hypothetical protein